MRVKALAEKEIKEALGLLREWKLVSGRLKKDFHFRDFSLAFSFMSRVASEAEKLDHHPDWCNSYNLVSISLITHAINAISQLDVDLAKKIDELN